MSRPAHVAAYWHMPALSRVSKTIEGASEGDAPSDLDALLDTLVGNGMEGVYDDMFDGRRVIVVDALMTPGESRLLGSPNISTCGTNRYLFVSSKVVAPELWKMGSIDVNISTSRPELGLRIRRSPIDLDVFEKSVKTAFSSLFYRAEARSAISRIRTVLSSCSKKRDTTSPSRSRYGIGVITPVSKNPFIRERIRNDFKSIL